MRLLFFSKVLLILVGARMRSFLGRNGFNVSIIIIICAYLYIEFTVMTRNDIMSLDININSCY